MIACPCRDPGTPRSGTLTVRLALPAGFRRAEVLALHGRDPLQTADCTDADSLCKGLVWRGRPAVLSVLFRTDHVVAKLMIDGAAEADESAALVAMVRRMLGLDQAVAAFERCHRHHPALGALIAAQSGLRVPQAATPFEALSWAVIGQQISVRAAMAVRARLIRAAGIRHSSGLYCYPDQGRLAALNSDALRAAGLSRSKAETLRTLAQAVEAGALPLDHWLATATPADDIRTNLLALRGIGPWTVDYALLRGFGHLDGSLHGDLGVRRALQRLLGMAQPPGPDATARWLAAFSPWRALVAAHLWAFAASANGVGDQNEKRPAVRC